MKIISNYTGNQIINNALMTIKALAGISSISELTTETLRELVLKVSDKLPYSLMELNLRYKNYTMLFSKNGPLYNDAKMGKQIYESLLLKIIDCFEDQGKYNCNFSGLQYDTSFTELFCETLKGLNVPEPEIKKKDLTLNRCWFPLLGSLGSDAQSLPMAKYTYNIHPIFIVILQFLPLSALLYKKGILLVDSSNNEFSEAFVLENVKNVTARALMTSINEPIENIKDFTKGHYTFKALEIMEQMHFDYGYIDINLWSFSNAGTGANCEKDRLPNALINKLKKLYISCERELKSILGSPNRYISSSFIDSLDSYSDWDGLYPAKNTDGVSVDFFEKYWETLGKHKETEIAKYIAYLITLYKTKSFEKYLSKTDACQNKNYKNDLNVVLITALKNGKWTFNHQLHIQTDSTSIPIKYGCWHLFKLIHFYYQKNEFIDTLPVIEEPQGNNAKIIRWIISLIEKDEKKASITSRLTDDQKYTTVMLDELSIRQASEAKINITNVFPILYDKNGTPKTFGILSLLRFYYLEQENIQQSVFHDFISLQEIPVPIDFNHWFSLIHLFVEKYVEYRCNKIAENNKKQAYIEKISRNIPRDKKQQYQWFHDIFERFNAYNEQNAFPLWNEEEIIYDPLGNYNFGTAIFAIRMKLNTIAYSNKK